MLWHPPEILFHLGALSIRSYGLFLGLAIFCGFWWAEQRTKTAKFPAETASDVFFWAIVGAILGARLGFVIQELSFFSSHPGEILAFWHGGLSFHGGLVGGILAGILILQHHRSLNKFWVLADIASAPLLLGAIIGRLGNWANQELYGYPTHVSWAIAIDPAHRLPGYTGANLFHPTFAYEMLLNSLGLLLLVFLVERSARNLSKVSPKPSGMVNGTSFLFVIAWYALARGMTEIWRIGDRLIGPLSLAQLISIFMILVAISLWRLRQRQSDSA